MDCKAYIRLIRNLELIRIVDGKNRTGCLIGRPGNSGKRLEGGFEYGACYCADLASPARFRRPGTGAGQGLEDGDGRLSALQYRENRGGWRPSWEIPPHASRSGGR